MTARATNRPIPIINPGLIFVKKTNLLGLFSGEPIFGGACISEGILRFKMGLPCQEKNTKITT